MKSVRFRAARKSSAPRVPGWIRGWTAVLLLAVFPAVTEAQSAPPPPQTPSSAQGAAARAEKPRLPTAANRRRATRLYLDASKQYLAGHFETALREYEQAAQLDPANPNYSQAAEVARSHAVLALIEAAAKDRLGGNPAGARAALERARALDPKNPEVTQHLYELGEDALRGSPQPLYQQEARTVGDAEPLLSAPGVRSFHLRASGREVIEQVFKAYGVEAMLDESVRAQTVRFDVDNVGFRTAARILGLVTETFYVPLDAHRVLVARDTRENRTQYTRQQMETVYLSGLTSTELTDVSNLARNVFGVEQVAADPGTSSLTLRAPPETLAAFNASMHSLLQGTDQVVLDVRLIQIADTRKVNRGVQPPQSFSAFNVYSEEQSILNSNQSLVQQIISSGLASPGDIGAILGILLASGQIPSSVFSGGVALFGGGLTQSALAPQPATLNLSLNSSESREIDDIKLRLGDGEAGTLKDGTRYPIQTSSYSSLSPTLPNIPGLTGAGTSSGLSSLLSSLTGSMPNIPMFQYQDLGLTLKVTPKVMRGGNVALTVDLSIQSLSGSTLDGNPIINNQAYSGVVTLRSGQDAEIAGQLSTSETRAISGTPGLSQIPGLNNITDKNNQKNASTLVIVLTPHLVRGTQPAGRTPMMLVQKTSSMP